MDILYAIRIVLPVIGEPMAMESLSDMRQVLYFFSYSVKQAKLVDYRGVRKRPL